MTNWLVSKAPRANRRLYTALGVACPESERTSGLGFGRVVRNFEHPQHGGFAHHADACRPQATWRHQRGQLARKVPLLQATHVDAVARHLELPAVNQAEKRARFALSDDDVPLAEVAQVDRGELADPTRLQRLVDARPQFDGDG